MGRDDATQKMKFSINNFFSKCDQIRGKLLIRSHLLKKSLMDNFIFCAVWVKYYGKRNILHNASPPGKDVSQKKNLLSSI